MQDWLEMKSRQLAEIQLEKAMMKQDCVGVSDDDRSHMYSPRSHPRANPSA